MMPEHVGPPPSLQPDKSYQISDRPAAAQQRFKMMTYDAKRQKIYYVRPRAGNGRVRETDGGGGENASSHNDAAAAAAAADHVAGGNAVRKGRPKGSKNKTSSAASDEFRGNGSGEFACSPAKCKSCDRTYEDPLAHCLEHHHGNVCPVCGRTSKQPLTAHINSHRTSLTVVERYQCYACAAEKTFGSAAAMAKHVLDEHVSNSRCAICGAACGGGGPPDSDGGGLREHVSATHLNAADTGGFPDRCDLCGERTGRDRLAEHLLAEHCGTTAAAIECRVCGVRLADRSAVVGHLVDAHCPRKTFSHPAVYRCRVCQAGFKSQINVLRHACNKIKTPYCDQCDKAFPSKMRYSFHLQFHEHPRCAPMHLRCDLCLAEFEDECHMYDHIRFRHELHDKAVCEVCGRTFKSTMGLNIHRRYHNGSRDFVCRSCDKSFLNKSTLKEHEISHMDVKPFQCHICGQYLSRASRLRSHVKTHKAAESTDQRCYSCARCGFVAPSVGLLEEHRDKLRHVSPGGGGQQPWTPNVVHLSSVVKCEFCDSTYVSSAHLDEHRDAAHADRSDSGAEAFICVVCSSTFSTYSRLTTHKLTHGINMESTLPANDDEDADEPPSGGDASPPGQRRRCGQQRRDRDTFKIPQFFSCQYCSKKCLHYTYFCLHRRLKHPPGVQTHACDKCSLNFKTSWRLAYHKKTVHGQQSEKSPEQYECSVCYRKFVKIGALNLHRTRTHIDIVGDICKYLCHQCGKFFSTQCSLRNHAKLHENGGGGGGDLGKRGPRHSAMAAPSTRRKTYRTRDPEMPPVGPGKELEKPRVSYDRETMADDEPRSAGRVNGGHVQLCPAVTSCRYPSGAVCVLCEENLVNSAQLKLHLERHAARNEAFLCTACSVPFLSSAALQVHLNGSHCCAPRASAAAALHVPQQSSVQFVSVPPRNRCDRPPPLVVHCSKTIALDESRAADAKTSGVPPAFTAARFAVQAASPAAAIRTTTGSGGDPESFVLDELLAILSTPRSSAALDDYAPPNDLNDLFNSICGSTE